MRVLWPVWRRLARRGLRLAGRALAGVAVLVLAPVLALATLGGLAGLTATPAVLLGAALGVFASIFFLGLLLLLPRPASRLPRWLRALAILGVEALVVWQVAAATLAPLRDALPPPPVAGQRIWELSTGSRLAYVVRKPKRSRGLPPVVVLHGGPGRADLGGDSAFFGALAADGRPVYVYDQVGGGPLVPAGRPWRIQPDQGPRRPRGDPPAAGGRPARPGRPRGGRPAGRRLPGPPPRQRRQARPVVTRGAAASSVGRGAGPP
ncbi:hypothetical protein GCM10020219_032590 [Nonomuraea dietziae]